MKIIPVFSLALLCLFPLTSFAAPAAPGRGVIIDTVIATVDEKPITLSDLRSRLTPVRPLSLEQAASDPEARALYERLIFEEVLLAEADQKKISTSEGDIERYLDEVAHRNNLTKDGLIQALAKEGKNIEAYKRQVKIDILQTRLGTSYMQSSGGITSEEIDEYLKDHPELTQGGATIKLRRILISPTGRDEADYNARAEDALKQITDDESFADVAKKMSDGPESAEGGLMGLVAEKDLTPEVFEALLPLKKGEHSGIIRSEQGLQIFQVEDRFSGVDEKDPQLIEEVRRRLQEEKFSSKIQGYFAAEIFKNHTVERKI